MHVCMRPGQGGGMRLHLHLPAAGDLTRAASARLVDAAHVILASGGAALQYPASSGRVETTMRIVVAALATLALIAGAAGDAGAQGHAKKRHKHAKAQVRQPATHHAKVQRRQRLHRARRQPAARRLIDLVDQMPRENRAGTCCN